MTSGYVPPKGEDPGPDEIRQALKKALGDNPDLQEQPPEEVARRLVRDGYLQAEPSPTLVGEMLHAAEDEKQGFKADELSERRG